MSQRLRRAGLTAWLAVGLGAGLPHEARAQVPIIDSSSDAPPAPPVAAAPTQASPSPSPAVPADASPSQSPSANSGDTVFLRDGSTIHGHVLKQSPGSFVVIRSAARELTIAWDQVQRVAVASDTFVEKNKQAGGIEGNGIGVGLSTERVVQLHDPTDHFWEFAIDGGVLYGTSTKGSSVSIYGGGADLNVQYRVGGQMPGTGGGSWNAFGFDLSGGIFGAATVEPDGFGGSTGSGLLLVSGTVSAGYQFMTFGKMSDEDLKQHGFGLFLGGKVGVANTQVFAQAGTISSTDPQYGPEVQLTFPEYNFGTTQRAAFYISGFLLPTGDFLFFNIQFGGSFN